jgi:GT2 family glycosyltransferase/SAM-dependent methyltransferase
MSTPDYYEHERPEVLDAIPRDAARVLDVGCGSGRLGEQIKQRQNATVWGIEVVQEAAEGASQRLDRVWNTSVEQALNDIAPESLDCIVTADVLEHLVDPWAILAELRTRLVPRGTIVASIPNVGHWDVIRDLLEGTWQYTSEGLLDRTHLRFFTRRSVRELFWTAGLAIRELAVIPRGGGVPPALVTALRDAGLRVARLPEEGQAFQYRVVAERRESPRPWPRVGIVVLTHNGKDDTLQCLESIQRLAYAPADTVVVHNGPADSSRDAIRARFPEVAFLEAGRTLGDATGTNLGMRHALERGAEYVLVLNDETVVDRTLLTRLMKTAALTPEAGLWGPRICDYSRPDTVWATGFTWDPRQQNFVKCGKGEEAPGAAENTVHVVDALTGFAMLVRRDVFERVGMFAPEYLFCWKEIDFCTRAIEQGFECVVVPAALVWRKIGASLGEVRPTVLEYFDTRNRLLWARRHLQPRQRRAVRRQVLQEVWQMLPLPPTRAAGARKFYWWVLEVAREFRRPLVRVRLRALFDHLLGRSGDCPEAVRQMAVAVHTTPTPSDGGRRS